jgi:hypothetical protein
VLSLVRWVEPETAPGSEAIKAILIDPEAGTIEHVEVDRTMEAIGGLVGGVAIALMTVPGDDVVYGKRPAPGWRWRKDDCMFNGRCVIAGGDRLNSLLDPVASVEVLRRTIEFGSPGKTVWVGYDKHPARLGGGHSGRLNPR